MVCGDIVGEECICLLASIRKQPDIDEPLAVSVQSNVLTLLHMSRKIRAITLRLLRCLLGPGDVAARYVVFGESMVSMPGTDLSVSYRYWFSRCHVLVWHLRQCNSSTWVPAAGVRPLIHLAHGHKYLMLETFGTYQKAHRDLSLDPWTLFCNAFLTVDYYEKLEHLSNFVTPKLSPWEQALLKQGVSPLKKSYVALGNEHWDIWAAERVLELANHTIGALNVLPKAVGEAFTAHIDGVLRPQLGMLHLRLEQSESIDAASQTLRVI